MQPQKHARPVGTGASSTGETFGEAKLWVQARTGLVTAVCQQADSSYFHPRQPLLRELTCWCLLSFACCQAGAQSLSKQLYIFGFFSNTLKFEKYLIPTTGAPCDPPVVS